MVRGILYYLLIWLLVSGGFYAYIRLGKREKSNLLHILLFGLATATFALAVVLLIVYLF